MRFAVEGSGQIRESATREEFDKIVDDFMNALIDLGAADPAVSGTLSTRLLEFEVSVEADTPNDSLARARDLVLEAFRRAEGEATWTDDAARVEESGEWRVRRDDELVG